MEAALAGVTVMDPSVLVNDPVTVSVAVKVRFVPTVFKVALKVPAPLVRVELAGKAVLPSLELKARVPLYPVAILLLLS